MKRWHLDDSFTGFSMWRVQAAGGKSSLLIAGSSQSNPQQTHFWNHPHAPLQPIPRRKSGKCDQVVGLFKSMSRFHPLDDNSFHRTLEQMAAIEQLNNWNIGADDHLSKGDSWRETQLEDGFLASARCQIVSDKQFHVLLLQTKIRSPSRGAEIHKWAERERWTILESDLLQCSGQWPVTVH